MSQDASGYTTPRIESMSEEALFQNLSSPQQAQTQEAAAGWYGYPEPPAYSYPQACGPAVYGAPYDGGVYGAQSAASPGAETNDSHRVPYCMMVDEGEHLAVRVELPGVTVEEITLDLAPMALTVSTSPKAQAPGAGAVPFWGSLDLDCEVELSPQGVTLENGVLTLQLVKAQAPMEGVERLLDYLGP